MKRTQIYLDDELLNVLKMQSKLKNKRMSNIIRETLREKFLKKKKRVSLLSNAAGIWKDRKFDVEKHVRSLRKGKRMSKLYEA